LIIAQDFMSIVAHSSEHQCDATAIYGHSRLFRFILSQCLSVG